MNDLTKLLMTSSNNPTLTHGATILSIHIGASTRQANIPNEYTKMLNRWKRCVSLIYQDTPQELAKLFKCLAAGYPHPLSGI